MTKILGPNDVIAFWFEQLKPEDWYRKSDVTDKLCTNFRDTHHALAANIPDEWRVSAESHLAIILVFDQLSRNIYRNTPMAFATDQLALNEAKKMVASGMDQEISEGRRSFCYMPFEHAEDIAEQDRAVELMTALGSDILIDYAHRHRKVIAEFGRFPHRNPIIGRASSPAEEQYLAQPGAGF